MDARDYPEAYLREEPIEPRGVSKNINNLWKQVVKLTAQRDELLDALLELLCIVNIHQDFTGSRFAEAEIEAANEAIAHVRDDLR